MARLLVVATLLAVGLAHAGPAFATATTFTVNATDDNRGLCGGFAVHCTLRAAIDAANGNPGTDTIRFSVSGMFIPGGTALPAVTDPVVIDGGTAPGASPNDSATSDDAVLTVVLSCDGQAFAGLTVGTTGAGSTIRGLVIQNCLGPGIELDGNANLVAGNFIGTTANGEDNQANQVGVQASSKDNVIGGTAPADRNLISGNSQDGVDLFDTGNTVEGNFIGTDATGTSGIPNVAFGVKVGDEANTIGGAGPGGGGRHPPHRPPLRR